MKKERVMKAMLLVLGLAMVSAAGCAHGVATVAEGRDVRGSARVGQEARLLVVGPAALVHATGEKPVRWFVADRVSGSDRDCARAASSGAVVLSESKGASLTVGAGHVLCAAVVDGATDVMWHERVDVGNSMWALR
jgi:hypothetical protein